MATSSRIILSIAFILSPIPLLPNKRRGVPRVDNCRVLDGISRENDDEPPTGMPLRSRPGGSCISLPQLDKF
ncbi:hypothetical protein D6851_15785 [Altericroceibacterium spongiae]|uniref:Uncharacterized protein n=1 Tax=Altericroceibacterium spongiae TaxID=2320269 RepID=A0A420EAK5_9SPHN|nr:hypothetical protein D6851_15785 [Altericroceibacterium spongiae]